MAPSVPISNQLPLYDYLKNLSSIAFAILGAWIALLIPSTVEKVEKRERTVETISTVISDLRPLTIPMNASLLVLVLGLIAVFCSTVLSKQENLYRYANIGRIISLEVLFLLSIVQIWAIAYAVFPVNKFMDFARQIKARRERIKLEKKR
ncbi:hypothetical protein [Geothrix paludis]|uniref:hypothetical protein n=1 Tax=Geothrix paludis TaxID=2922722 RepID=UPI001FADA562|nr:hypothetical protein [Geothrix paludis]